MEYGIVSVPAAPVRKKARHQSEMSSQLLFGEKVKLLKEKGPLWVKVRSLHDDYEGWVTRTLLEEITKEDATLTSPFTATGVLNTIVIDDKEMNIPFGASLPALNGQEGRLASLPYIFPGASIDRRTVAPNEEHLRHYTFQWLNAPYMWGGRTILGVDCSGFVQVNYKLLGIDLPRDAWQQAQKGRSVKKLSDARCGDLAFFDDKDEIVHVGIILGDGTIIHSSGRVRVDAIDKKGIVHSGHGKRTHSLRLLRRYW